MYIIYKYIAMLATLWEWYTIIEWKRMWHHSPSDSFIKKRKLDKLKEEALSSGDNEFNGKNGIKMFNEQLMLKSKQVIDAEQVKSIIFDAIDVDRTHPIFSAVYEFFNVQFIIYRYIW